jgi:hypothetical protein
MWRELTNPDVLIFLDASRSTICERLNVDWDQSYIDELARRLADARAHADFTLATDGLDRDEVSSRVVEFLKTHTAS